jgi:hypothetical protein
MQTTKNHAEIKLPEGEFGGNCSDCCHYFSRKRDSPDGSDRAYCDHYDAYYYPDERNGCAYYEKK